MEKIWTSTCMSSKKCIKDQTLKVKSFKNIVNNYFAFYDYMSIIYDKDMRLNKPKTIILIGIKSKL